MTFVATGRNVDHTIAVRVTTDQAAMMNDLRATFPDAKWSHAFRWLLDLPEVRTAIAERVDTIGGDEPQ